MRRYGQWAGNPKGTPENKTRCIVEVTRGRWRACQCARKRGHGPDGLYCKQHAAKLEKYGSIWTPPDEPEQEAPNEKGS